MYGGTLGLRGNDVSHLHAKALHLQASPIDESSNPANPSVAIFDKVKVMQREWWRHAQKQPRLGKHVEKELNSKQASVVLPTGEYQQTRGWTPHRSSLP